jgi:GTP:adenosylcobinamide-phosphate guanylyltransferase
VSALALLVAGGRGERLAATHPQRPKALVEVGGVALLDRNLERVAAAGLREVWIAVGHRAEEVAKHIFSRAGTPELIVERTPLGTIGALAYVPQPERDVLVVNADLFSAIDLAALLAVHAERQADLTIATHFEEHRLKLGGSRSTTRAASPPTSRSRPSGGASRRGPTSSGRAPARCSPRARRAASRRWSSARSRRSSPSSTTTTARRGST